MTLLAGLAGCRDDDPAGPYGWVGRPLVVATDEDRARALGDLSALDPTLRLALGDTDGFEPFDTPAPGSWQYQQREPQEDYETFALMQVYRPTAARRTIYLQPIGDFPAAMRLSLDDLRDYAARYFQLPVRLLSAVSLAATGVTRRNRGGGPQVLTSDVRDWLVGRFPSDAYLVVAVTMLDLYPGPDWNFVFGEASAMTHTGVYSFHRFGDPTSPLFARRAMGVLGHELAHLFGLGHCVFYRCQMNGANGLGDADETPLHACPICLRKLQLAAGFDVVKRTRELLAFHAEKGDPDEAGWLRERLERLTDAP